MIPSDDAPEVLAAGSGGVSFAVLSMSRQAVDAGAEAEYLRWHLLDHLPEQHRIDGLRFGQRWRSTSACRAVRSAGEPPYDAVDHLVGYLFGGPVDAALGTFFDLGAALHRAGRMPVSLPRVQVGGWEVVSRAAAPRVLVGADVVPWRPMRGVYVVIEPAGPSPDPAPGGGAGGDALLEVDGVAGVWRCRDGHGRHRRLDPVEGLELTLCFVDGDLIETAESIGSRLRSRWERQGVRPLLGAPFATVDPWSWEQRGPGGR